MRAPASSSRVYARADYRTIETAVRAVETIGLIADYFSAGRCEALARNNGKLVTLPTHNMTEGQDEGRRGPRIILRLGSEGNV